MQHAPLKDAISPAFKLLHTSILYKVVIHRQQKQQLNRFIIYQSNKHNVLYLRGFILVLLLAYRLLISLLTVSIRVMVHKLLGVLLIFIRYLLLIFVRHLLLLVLLWGILLRILGRRTLVVLVVHLLLVLRVNLLLLILQGRGLLMLGATVSVTHYDLSHIFI